jgi:hypothetical protein
MKLLIKPEKNTKRSNQTSVQSRKARKPARVIPFRPIYAAAAHTDSIQQHLGHLKLIQGAYSESVLSSYRDTEASPEEKKGEFRKSMKQLGATLASWHCRTLDLLEQGKKLKADFTDQHAELEKALAFFGAPKLN